MRDNVYHAAAPVGQEIRRLRQERGWTLVDLARRAGTSAPTLHRYENGWDRFEIDTLRRIARALEATLDVRIVPAPGPAATRRRPSARTLLKKLSPLFWERNLKRSDFTAHAGWVLERVLTGGSLAQVRAARAFFGDEAVRLAAARRGVDRRTRQFWRLILGRGGRAPQSDRR